MDIRSLRVCESTSLTDEDMLDATDQSDASHLYET